ncbi:TonB-dependent siderophore receptor [Bdellovibrio sp. HCB209]|uniref:TonB-dependent siderophore receptor n=1 Tax=Bdellovibrio sp. HCB209 TaxID=3394354 RepID=UPI0039B3E8A1
MQFYVRSFALMLNLTILIGFNAKAEESSTQLAPVIVHDKIQSEASLLGFESMDLAEVPVSADVYSAETLEKNHVLRLADLTSLESSLSDSYNATGYWDMLSIRGYTLDNRSNYRRENLPISAETAIPLENKAGVVVLKGLSGIQSGASSPGGLINYQIKRPLDGRRISVRSDVNDSGGFLLAADANSGLVANENMDYRVNVAHESLSPHLKSAKGQRSLVAGALSIRLPEQSMIEGEIEWSQRSQPSQAGFSLLGDQLPQLHDPNINLNNQPWSEPVVFRAITGSLKYTKSVNENFNISMIGGVQILGNDDHLAYPYGCTKDGSFDRYCSDSTFDMYDFRSDNESRETYALRLSLDGKFTQTEFQHSWSVGAMTWNTKERYQRQAYNYVGEGNINGTVVLPADPSLTDESTNRDSRNLQISLADSVKWNSWTGWLGASWNGISRASVRTDGSRATDYYQSFMLPWAALSYDLKNVLVYVSYAEGMESFVTPNRNTYSRPGEFLSDVGSSQYELGLRGKAGIQWNVAVFKIDRPLVADAAPNYQVDGIDQHTGFEADIQGDFDRFTWNFGGMWLRTERKNSELQGSLNGRRAVNVPDSTLRAGADYKTPWPVGFDLRGRISYEGERAVTADNTLVLPGWVRWDAGVGYAMKSKKIPMKIDLWVQNLTDNNYWRESPTQYGHIYLYPGEERAYVLSAQIEI